MQCRKLLLLFLPLILLLNSFLHPFQLYNRVARQNASDLVHNASGPSVITHQHPESHVPSASLDCFAAIVASITDDSFDSDEFL